MPCPTITLKVSSYGKRRKLVLSGSFTHLHAFFFLDYLASRLSLAWYLYHCRLWRFFCLVSLSSNVLCLMIDVQCLIRLDHHVSAFENHTTMMYKALHPEEQQYIIALTSDNSSIALISTISVNKDGGQWAIGRQVTFIQLSQ